MDRRHLAWLIPIAGALGGCSVGSEAGHPASSTAAPEPSAPGPSAPGPSASSAKADATTPATSDDWREAARRLDWKRAYALLSALPAEERSSPEMRLALGRIALGAGEHAAAVQALEGLDAVLPLAAEEARRWYAEAAAVAGPHDAAASFLARSPKVRDLLEAGQALERAGKHGEARKLYDKAIQRADRTRRRDDATHGRLLRARLAEKTGDKAVASADYRWLIVERPGEPEAREALEGIDRVGGTVKLDERLTALASSSTKDNVDTTLTILDGLQKKHAAQAVAIEFARAKALYQARDYARAKGAFDVVRKKTSPFAAESYYFGAQATARTGDATAALALFQEVAKRFPKSMYAERGAYRHAELLSLIGKHAEAAEAFARYLSRYGRGGHVTDARFGQAIALLSAGEPGKARKIFRNLRLEGDKGWREGAHHQHLEALAAAKEGDAEEATKLWLELIREQPLTYPAMAAHARLKALGHEPLPPPIAPAPAADPSPLGPTMPTAPALLASLGLDRAAEQRLEALEDDAAKGYPGRESEALCDLYGQLAGAERRVAIANRAVSLDALMRPPSPADRWAWECIYPRPFADVVSAQEKARGVPPGLVHAIMRQESFFRTTVTSPVGARGLMQLMPSTAARAAGEVGLSFTPTEIVRPDVNVTLGTFYLGKLLDNFHGHPALAAAAYNAGPIAVARWLEGGEREADLFVARIPYGETRTYVQRVLANFARYQYLAGGVEAVAPFELAVPETVDIGADAY